MGRGGAGATGSVGGLLGIAARRGERGERVVGEDLVGDQRQAAGGAEGCQGLLLGGGEVGAGGIAGMDQRQEPRARGERKLDGFLGQAAAGRAGDLAEDQGVEAGQAVEQRVGGHRRQQLVARVCEELEEVRVRLAGGGGEHEVFG